MQVSNRLDQRVVAMRVMRPIDLLNAVRGNDYAIASVIFFCIGFRDEGAKGIIVSHLEEYRCGCLLQSFYEFGLDVEDIANSIEEFRSLCVKERMRLMRFWIKCPAGAGVSDTLTWEVF